jgi:DeoR family fructose operon transcriptional repressor
LGRVSKHVTDARRAKLRELLSEHTYLPLSEVCKALRISEATARRDLASLEDQQLIRRTHGGALSQGSPALGEYEASFPTFEARRRDSALQKEAIATAAVGLLADGTTVFLDAGTTCFAAADALAGQRFRALTVVTHSIAAALRLARIEGITVHLLAGRLLPRQGAMFGPETLRSLSGYRFARALLSCEGFDAQGTLNSQDDVVQLQRAVIGASASVVHLLDRSKLDRQAPIRLAGWTGKDVLVTDAAASDLFKSHVPLKAGQVIFARVAT